MGVDPSDGLLEGDLSTPMVVFGGLGPVECHQIGLEGLFLPAKSVRLPLPDLCPGRLPAEVCRRIVLGEILATRTRQKLVQRLPVLEGLPVGVEVDAVAVAG